MVLGDRYQLAEPVGQGGMGSVWRARDLVLGREVAIKLLTDELARARFCREAAVLARLTHPRLARLYDYGEHEGTAFLVMEYLAGPSLETRVPLQAAEAAEMLAQVADGVHAVHQAGVVHRDIKPANIILTTQGAMLVDFGIATGDTDEQVTEIGSIAGSAPYLAPERAGGKPATPATDIYALGIVLYEALTGRPPFAEGHPLETINAHVHAPVPPLPWQVPEQLAAVCMRALDKNPARRQASAQEFARELRAATQAGQNHTRVYQHPVQPVSHAARRRGLPVPALVGASAAGAAAVAVAATLLLHHAPASSPAQHDPVHHTIPGAYASFDKTMDNTGISSVSAPTTANFDGYGYSYQTQALSAAGYLPGAQVAVGGVSFTWPSTSTLNDTVARGQTFMISGSGSEIAFLGASAYGSAGGDGQILYTDGTRQPFRLVMDDWDATAATPGEDTLAITTSAVDAPTGAVARPGSVYFAAIPLRPGKTVEAVTLPTTSLPAVNVPSLHIFAVSIS
jgi:serine/threonine protein kinase